MTWAILLAFLVVIGIVSLASHQQVPWASKLRRIKAGVANQAEWLAPDYVMNTAREDYLMAVGWLAESTLEDWSLQWSSGPYYLSGLFLKRHQEILKYHRMGKSPRYIGVLRCVHQVEVRHFSDDGERCLIVDHQTERRMANYDYWSKERHSTQDIGAGTMVYELVYDKQDQRWKIERFIQELPITWKNTQHINKVQVMNVLPRNIGRDN